MQVLVEVERSGFVESQHLGAVAVCDQAGTVLLAAGDPDLMVLPRSSTKPFQALAGHRLGTGERLGLGDEALAIACGSHQGEPAHVEAVLAILAAAGLSEDDLRCPPALPRDPEALAAAGGGERRAFHNCSGKHAWMLATAVTRGWTTDRYLAPDHPLQAVITDTVVELAGTAAGHIGIDGCGAPVHALPLRGLATAFARLAGGGGGEPTAVVTALRRHPSMIAGSGRLDTRLLEATRGRLLAKVGAEAVYGVVNLATGQGAALKVVDGGARAAVPALLAVLDALGWLDEAERGALVDLAVTEVLGGGKPVGSVRPAKVALAQPG
jgi:L-asparaginase II